jgi:hypothetical protein
MLHYEKRKNNKFFENIQSNKKIQMLRMQNFIPIYSKFFSLNDTNYNNINLNHEWYVSKILNKQYHDDYIFSCELKNVSNPEFKIEQKTFIKMAPLLEPYKYLFGKYSNYDNLNLFNLPSLENENVHSKISDENNSSYVDSFFCYLSSQLLNKHKIINCIDFYGSFLGLKKNYKINIIDDIEYLVESDYFNKNQNKLFQIEDYSHLIYKPKLTPIKIINNEDIDIELEDINANISDEIISEQNLEQSELNLLSLSENNDVSELTESNINLNNKNDTYSSSSSCSSRTSHSNSNDLNDSDISSVEENKELESDENVEYNSSNETTSSISDIEEEMLFVTFNEFPIQLIFLECCDGTLDSLILNNDDLPHEEIFSALMQIIMTLLIYQKTFSLTHNDLHTNNIMYVKTNLKYLYYKYNNKTYKVPTFGRIYKIIDFGRAIYKVNGLLICSDSFKNGNDAATQYNSEPYFNDKKSRLEPNFSFDLCRLACSMFDYFVDEIDDVKDLSVCEPLVKLITEWCLDDNGVNILYKNTGVERYPNFKLYKMIARLVHNHTPEAQLERDEFKKYLISNKTKIDTKNTLIINLDYLPSYTENI